MGLLYLFYKGNLFLRFYDKA
jgi:hypothetical protein